MTEAYRHTLSNGLRVVVHPDRNTAMVDLDIIYNVGARDEHPSRTGMAHLFEHLMFGSSAHVPSFDSAVENAGGLNNAWTSNDFTNFYTVVPAVNAETAFWVESDRMLAPHLTGNALEVQREVVIEEFKQTCLNKPYGDRAHHLRALAYTSHPYRYPTLGLTPDHVASVTEDDVTRFFNEHYAPNNAVMAVTGNIEPDKAFMLAERYFGDIPPRDVAPRSYRPEPPVTSARRRQVTGSVPHTLLTIAFPMGAFGAPDYMVADVITDVLASGQSSRLMRDVVMKGDVISAADASILGSDEPGLLMVTAILKGSSDKDISRAEELIWNQLDKISASGASSDELVRCYRRNASLTAFNRLSYVALAEELAIGELQGENIDTRLDRYKAVTGDSIRDVASALLRRERSITLVYSPDSI